jgi:hypothetical protein
MAVRVGHLSLHKLDAIVQVDQPHYKFLKAISKGEKLRVNFASLEQPSLVSIHQLLKYKHGLSANECTLIGNLLHIELVFKVFGVSQGLWDECIHLIEHDLGVEATHLPASAKVADKGVEGR